ncbi:hypothetical protein, partial [Nostoc sp.]
PECQNGDPITQQGVYKTQTYEVFDVHSIHKARGGVWLIKGIGHLNDGDDGIYDEIFNYEFKRLVIINDE